MTVLRNDLSNILFQIGKKSFYFIFFFTYISHFNNITYSNNTTHFLKQHNTFSKTTQHIF